MIIAILLVSNLLLLQTPWEKSTTEGYSIDNGKLDETEGFGAYMDLPLKPMTRNFDNGGGTHDYNTQFLKKHYGVENYVYDPFQRSEEENAKVLQETEFDTATSMSVLNVIDQIPARLDHIFLSCQTLKAFGTAYFKVFENHGDGKEEWKSYGYQANLPTREFQKEVEQVFGEGNVVTDTLRHLIIAYKNTGCNKPSSQKI